MLWEVGAFIPTFLVPLVMLAGCCRMSDVLIVGGGIIGLTSAYELAKQGCSVTILERGCVGREASWAGAGMLPPCEFHPNSHEFTSLTRRSFERWPTLTAELRELTGIDNGFRQCGTLQVCATTGDGQLAEEADRYRQMGVTADLLEVSELRERFPFLHPGIARVLHLPEFCQVRNPRQIRCLKRACEQLGVTIREGEEVREFSVSRGMIHSMRTQVDEYACGEVVVASGAWSEQVMGLLGIEVPVLPIHGQIVLLGGVDPNLKSVVEQGSRYIVPRGDGRVLVGSTIEQIGFEKRVREQDVNALREFACSLVPELEDAEIETTWSGLRPGSAAGLPYLGRVAPVENLVVATGHYRSGLQLSAITGRIVAAFVNDNVDELGLDLSDFAVPQMLVV